MLKAKKETTSGPVGNPGATSGHNSLVQGTVLEGTIKSENDIRIDGALKGNLICNAKVIIGPSGKVEGEVNCIDAVIEGQFDGNIEVKELLNVRKTAKVTGDVVYGKLIVEGGSVFNVSCSMGQTDSPKRLNTGNRSRISSDVAAESTS